MRMPYGYLNDSVEDKRCPDCGSKIAETYTHERVQAMNDPPRQLERFRRFVRWQCLRFEEHYGDYDIPVDDPSSSPHDFLDRVAAGLPGPQNESEKS